ncbi:hypothetical protein BCR42DRAFT_419696 [Absidia repens]|uniref:Uncharacterized protein n=1 Tax=Absidia repens TaxID=90262 RepID=A0A1X2IAB6_9FUNG|nr:hypothetical protein BCR42DRAFT_419696 [Absidia repens]
MSNQEQDHLEKTLAILSKRLIQAQAQCKHTKKTIHSKKAFLLSSKSILQQDFGHVFKLNDQNGTRRRRKKRVLQGPPPGLVPLLSNEGLTHKETTEVNNGLTVISCKGIILQDRVWLRLTFLPGTERISQAHLTWLAPSPNAWAPNELDRSTLHGVPATPSSTSSSYQQYLLYAATTLPPHILLSPGQVERMDIKVAVRYIVDDNDWLDSASVSIEWTGNYQWITEDIENIHHWAPILYPYKVHLSLASPLQPTKDWTSLNDDIHIASDASLLLVQGKGDPFSSIRAQLYGIKNQYLASWLSNKSNKNTTVIPWDGIALDTRHRLQHSIVSLIDQSQSLTPSAHTKLVNREHSLVKLSTLLSSSSSK